MGTPELTSSGFITNGIALFIGASQLAANVAAVKLKPQVFKKSLLEAKLSEVILPEISSSKCFRDSESLFVPFSEGS